MPLRTIDDPEGPVHGPSANTSTRETGHTRKRLAVQRKLVAAQISSSHDRAVFARAAGPDRLGYR